MTATITTIANIMFAGDGMPVSGDAQAIVRSESDREYAATLASTRLWGNTSYVPGVGNRRSVAAGTTLVAEFGTLPSVTVAEHDTSRFSDGEYGVERYLI